jgi:hypothetical protein
VVNLRLLENLQVDGPITPDVLFARGVTRGLQYPVKILGTGDLAHAVEVRAHGCSESARTRIEAAGGSVQIIERSDQWISARPRSRRLPLNTKLKQARVGKVGGPRRKEALSPPSESAES